MSKRNMKSHGRARSRRRPAPQVLDRHDEAGIAQFFAEHGLALMPLAQMLSQCKLKLNDVMAEAGQALVEWLLELSAHSVAGARSQGREVDREVVWHGRQAGRVRLLERELRVQKPRLRTKGPGSREVLIPAYEAMRRDEQASQRMSEILLAGVSSRRYATVLPKMAATVGVSRSQLSRKLIQAGARLLEGLRARRLETLDILAVYIDGLVIAGQSLVVAMGVDGCGDKHLLGMKLGATENARVVSDLLAELIERGLNPDDKYLFIIDGSKALRAAIQRSFGDRGLVQRCRVHKVRGILDYLPAPLKAQTKAILNAAFQLPAKEGIAKLRQQALWLKKSHPQAAASLLEGIEELFTVNALGLTPSLMRCLTSTNAIESPNGRFRAIARNVTRWRDGEMIERWAAVAFLEAEKGWRKIHGHRDLWILRKALGRTDIHTQDDTRVDQQRVAA